MSVPWRYIAEKHGWRPERQGLDATNINSADYDGETLLHLAAFAGDRTDVAVLIASGAGLNLAGDLGNRPLHLAAMRGHVEVVNILLAHGANALAQNEFGETPLDVARQAGHRDIANILGHVSKS